MPGPHGQLLMSVARKKVIVRKWAGDYFAGYLASPTFPDPAHVTFLALDGKATLVPAEDVKWICFVRDFTGGDAGQPDRLLQKTFVRRPRSSGIWFRIRLQDNDVIEGLAQNDLSFLDSSGLSFYPPDTRSNTQRIVTPRSSIREMEVLAVIRAGMSRSPVRALQPSLFREPK